MTKFNLNFFSVFGNPISHTQSPYIHKLFADQTNIVHKYDARLVPINKFDYFIKNFFLNGGYGANITAPFKKNAYLLSDKLTKRAKISGAVNTFKKLKNNIILGDNTDGEGILYDLKRIKFLNKNHNNVLIIGSGGAACGIIYTLLSHGCNISVINRTFEHAQSLKDKFKKYGQITVLKHYQVFNSSFDIIINTIINTSKNSNLCFLSSFVNEAVFCYDINYFKDNTLTPFLIWCLKNGAKNISNGIGMLISQAAYSFYLWHSVLPDIESAITCFKQKYYK